MRIRVQHETCYRYDVPAALGPHVVRLTPATHARARLVTYDLKIEPEGELRWQHDPWGNRIVRVTWPAGTRATALKLAVEATFDVSPVNPFDFFVDDRAKDLPFTYPDGLQAELAPFLATTPGPLLQAWLAGSPAKGNTIDHLVALNARVARDVRYLIRPEAGLQSSEDTLRKRSGSCRDVAQLVVDAVRAQGLAARFVSGYLVQLTDEGVLPDEQRGVMNDVVDLHAWAEVFVPGAGWVGLDATSGLLCGEGHIPLCATMNPELAAPVTGTSDQAATGFEFAMRIERLGHEVSPRRPYTDEQWAALRAAGDAVDARLADHGLEVTMGGEPTWTSREHLAEPEWNAEAMGPTKWAQGLRLARRLRERLPEGAVALETQGKLYPGETRPRWGLELVWRTDGAPIWRDSTRLDLGREPRPKAKVGAGPAGNGAGPAPRGKAAAEADVARARRFMDELVARLRVDPGHVREVFEDPWAQLGVEANLPPDVDAARAAVDDSEARRRLARLLDRGLGTPAGLVLPIDHDGRWLSSSWQLRRAGPFLIPGESPIGLRLPLDRLAGGPASALFTLPADTSSPPPLPPDPRLQDPQGEGDGSASARRAAAVTVAWANTTLRTALCVEPRDGALHVFLPPVRETGAWLALVAHVEDAAAACDERVRLEGYRPHADPRLRRCVVTPDPGVLEVNLPWTASFREYVSMLELAADAANHAGLTAERWQLDGRESGPGGGHHLTMGGRTPLQSPFLQRPHLLGSLLRYVQNHPCLSYLFTGLFIGPTSQAPRIDEARHDALDELELALTRFPRPGEPAPAPALVDRLLRNLLCDVAGNTHRTELSIDKLWDPAGPAGRQGLIELRAFEMPPHERMAVAQMLLVRALVAWFSGEPYERPLVRWGQRLHDEFMLPHALWRDLEDVCADLRRAGLPLDAAFFRPFLELRFPRFGRLETEAGVTLELRQALEPWPVLGEEATAQGVSRYVDSSLERLEVLVEGLVEGRHVVLVNGHALPLRATGKSGEAVAGVRFRAWQPPNCLQPTIGLHHPLRFDVVDTWGHRSLGACTYHVWHPLGRGYDAPPLTAFEAAARRAQRFTTQGHLQHPVAARPADPRPGTPWTLDLRWLPLDRPRPRFEPANQASR